MKKNFAILLAAALLLCLLPGMMPKAKAETVRTTCYFCKEYVDQEKDSSDTTTMAIGYFSTVRVAVERTNTYLLAIHSAFTPAAPKRRPAPRAKPAPSAALNTTSWATTGASGNPRATTVSISATASAKAAMRSTPDAAPATAARPALRWEHAAPVAGSTTATMPSPRGLGGTRILT